MELHSIRTQLDALDSAIIALIAERSEVSRRFQVAKEVAGLPRTDISRETDIRERYLRTLGCGPGDDIWRSILAICKGN